MDILAREIGMDPLQFRRINAMRPGSRTATGQQLKHSVGILKTLDALQPGYAEALSWKAGGQDGPIKKGIGLGSMWYGIGNMAAKNPSSAKIRVDERCRVHLCSGAADIGQGSNTILCQISREVLGVEPGLIEVVTADTGRTPDAGATSASRQTYISGNAVLDASRKMAADLLGGAAQLLERPLGDLSLRESWVVDSRGKHLMPLAELLEKMVASRGPLQWDGYFDPITTALDPETGQGIPFATYTFASHLATVEVDSETGTVRVDKIVAAQDVGKAINPQSVLGQIQGGVGMGIGFALMEEFQPGNALDERILHPDKPGYS